jgi:hypothetical protein
VSDIPAPQDPASQRLLKAVVIGLGALIVIALGFVVMGMVSKFSAPRPVPPAAAAAFALPKDGRVVEMQVASDRLILHVRSPAGDEVDILDASDGRLVARIR